MMKTYLVLFCVLCLIACHDNSGDDHTDNNATDLSSIEELAEQGRKIFRDRNFGAKKVACVDCHADFDELFVEGDVIKPGHSVLGAHNRARTWNNEFSGAVLLSSAAGSSKCAYLYQARGHSPADALSQPEADALMAFFKYISTGEEALLLQWDVLSWPGDTNSTREYISAEITTLEAMKGNAERGEVLFRRACAYCHIDNYAPGMRSLRRNVTRVVRIGHKAMPFFSRDKLSDQDVADIRSFLEGR